jgi:hypothetical protein
MGTATIRIPVPPRSLAIVLIFTASALWARGPVTIDPFFGKDEPFEDVAAIDAFATQAFIGGYGKRTFVRGEKELVIIVGMTTFGLATSTIVVFDKGPDGKYRFMLIRRRLYALVTVKEEHDNIVFSGKTTILVIPWDGVVLGMEQKRRLGPSGNEH